MLGTGNYWQGLGAALPSPCTTTDSMLCFLCRMSSPSKRAESAAGSWCSCFCLGKPSPVAKRQLQSSAREPSEAEVLVLAGKGANPAFKTLLVSNTGRIHAFSGLVPPSGVQARLDPCLSQMSLLSTQELDLHVDHFQDSDTVARSLFASAHHHCIAKCQEPVS